MTSPRRRARPASRSGELGRLGEDEAARFLATSGYRCVARNLRTRCGEIDLLVRRRRLWVAVEVKTRSADPAPERSVDDRALRRLTEALQRLAPCLRPRPTRLRVDVVAVRRLAGGALELRHFPGDELAPPE